MKRKRPATDRASAAAVGACDDIVGTILARLPARTAIACTALSKHHRNLIHSPEFRSLHCSLGALLPRPHVAYLAAASVRRRQEEEHPASGYYGFHLAGAGLSGNGEAPAPMRSLAGWRYLGTECVNTCNGVLFIASEGFSDPCRCILWNPAVADEAREAPIPKPPSSEKNASVPVVLPGEEKKSAVRTRLWNKKTQFLALGLGYGRRSNTYKLLLCRKDSSQISRTRPSVSGKQTCRISGGTTHHFEYSLVVQSLGAGSGTADTPLLRTVSSLEIVLAYKEEVDQEIMERKSIYMDGTIYFLYRKENVMLAFDVDDETTIHTIDMPGERQEDNVQLIEMSSRPCVVIIAARDCIALWRLSTHLELEPIHVISYNSNLYYGCRSIVGVWDCGGVLVLCFECSKKGKLLLYDVAAKKTFRANLPGDLTMKKPEYMLCWGYRPTLVSPGSIVGEINQDRERRRVQSAHITEVIKPLVQQDRRKGQKATMKTVCLMELLVRIMQKLPHDMQDVVEMPSMDSEEPDLLFKNVV